MYTILRPRFFIFSISFHLIIFLFLMQFGTNNNLSHRFRIFGIHSSKPSFIFFKSIPKFNSAKVVERKSEQKVDSSLNIKRDIDASDKNNKSKNQVQSKLETSSKKKSEIVKSKKQATAEKLNNKNEPKINKKVEKIEALKKEEEKQKENKNKESLKAKERIEDLKNKEVLVDNKNIKQNSNEKNIIEGPLRLRGDALSVIEGKICQAFARVWTPPVNVPKGTECVIKFKVSSLGKIEKFSIERPSKMLIYDMSIINILDKVILPVEVWGKIIPLEFVQ